VIGTRRVLGLIPARGGSKGLPRKNVLPVNGRPLIAWTVDAGRAARSIDRLVLSSDDAEIIATARACGCEVPFVRPAELASDAAGTLEVVLHALDALPGFDYVVLLQPTSPLRTASDIDAACTLLAERSAPACVSLSPVDQHPYWMYQIGVGARLAPVIARDSPPVRRQDLPAVYALNGAVYIAEAAWLRTSRTFVTDETIGYVMPAERALDIDTRVDFDSFQNLMLKDPHASVSASP
jgi:CMP-N,N'-diacetyllegionaminic acid synthase